jgi:hypothetical protein
MIEDNRPNYRMVDSCYTCEHATWGRCRKHENLLVTEYFICDDYQQDEYYAPIK